MNERIFALKGNIIYSKDLQNISVHNHSYVICEDGFVVGVFEQLPEQYQSILVTDYGDQLIIPGLVDLHLHAPQYSFRGLNMDLELLEWLNQNTFPEEAKYADISYAEKAYDIFVNDLKSSATTRFSLFATLHNDATLLLADKLEQSGLKGFIGKVNMDRNSPPDLCEASAEVSLVGTQKWLMEMQHLQNIKPILTPRFTPSCTDELMRGLGEIKKQSNLPVQSHLSENPSEVAWVAELCPECNSYADTYERDGMLTNSIMAHCVYLTDNEMGQLKNRETYIAHCPMSNTDLSSGIAPIRTFLEKNIHVGLGTDIAGGHSLSIFQTMVHAIQVSKLYWRLCDESKRPLAIAEAFYLATKGGGSFFGNVGSFEPKYEFDAIVLDDSALLHPQQLTTLERLERYIYLSDDASITAKYVSGSKINI